MVGTVIEHHQQVLANDAAARTGRAEAIELADRHWGLVHRIVRDFVQRRTLYSVDIDDLVSVGSLALVHASHGFDPRRGVPFEAYAAIRIRGELFDELRRMDPLGRTARRRLRETLDAADPGTRTGLGREPRQTAGHAPPTPPARPVSLDQVTEGALAAADAAASRASTMAGDPAALAVRTEQMQTLRRAIEELPQRHRELLVGYYFEGRTLRTLADQHGIHHSRVHQLIGECHRLLRERLEPQPQTQPQTQPQV